MSRMPTGTSKGVSSNQTFLKLPKHAFPDLTTRAIDPMDLVELKTQQALASAWFTLSPTFPPSQVHVLPSIEHAITLVEQLQSEGGGASQVLVTGSLHLVGGVIEVAGLSGVAI